MAELPRSPRPPWIERGLPKVSSPSSIPDMRANEAQKLRVLVASNGAKDVAQAEALVVRLSKNSKIETRAILDEEAYPVRRLSHETLTLQNKSFKPCKETGEAQKHHERQVVESCRQQAYELCEWADMMVLAPMDADTFAKMLHGITDCLLLEILRGWDISKKLLLVPGMTTLMWENPTTKKQLSKVRRKWQWVRVMQPILWHYDNGPSKCLVGWDGFNELVDVIKNQAELLVIGHDVDIATSGAANMLRCSMKTGALLPPEIWHLIFEYVGDWEVSRALHINANIPTPAEWQRGNKRPKDEVHRYMRSLEWTILTSPIHKIIEKLEQAPQDMRYLSSLCVKLIIKFCLTDVLAFLEMNLKDLFWSSFGQKLLPTKASAVYGRTEILEWWRTSPTFLSKDYTAEAIDGASKSGFVHVLDWWLKSGLPLKYTEVALEQASSKGHLLVLEWWKQASLHPESYHRDVANQHRHAPQGTGETQGRPAPPETQPALHLKPGKALLAAAQNNQSLVLRWWDSSGIPTSFSESVARVASQHGHVAVLDTWKALKGEKMTFDNQVLEQATKNGHVEVLEWWKNYSMGEDGRPGGSVEYKTCYIEEALEDFVGNQSQEDAVKRWWAKNGLNLGVGVSEWTKVKIL
jgi:3-polyprenyl-4-hydroxybenzoate decarboxylase